MLYYLIIYFNLYYPKTPRATGVTFGNTTNAPIKCAMKALNDSNPYAPMPVFWLEFLYYILDFIFLSIVILTARIFYFYNTKDGRQSITTADMKAYDAFKTMMLYPISMAISWFPIMFYRLYTTTHNSNTLILNIVLLFSSLYGLFLSLIFYIKTKAARKEWFLIYQQVFNITNEIKELELIDNVIHNDDNIRIHRIIDV